MNSPDHRIQGSTQRITTLYIAALSTIALLAIAGQGVIQYSIVRMEDDARIVNIAGRQRMLSQRMTRMAMEAWIDSTQVRSTDRSEQDIRTQSELTQTIERDLDLWCRIHLGLQRGSAEFQLAGNNSPTIMGQFDKLANSFDAVKRELERLVQQAVTQVRDPSGLKTLASQSDAYLEGMDAIVARFELEARDRVARLRWIEMGLLLATMFVLLLEGFAVFSPAIGALRTTMERLQLSSDTLDRAKQVAERANRAKTEFLNEVSHELRTPLHAILGMLSLVGRGKLTPTQRKRIRIAKESSASLKEIVDDLLDVAGIEEGRDITLHPVPMELHGFLARGIALMRPFAVEKQLTLDLDVVPADPIWIRIDGTRLRQIVNNLLQNAVRYTLHGGVRCTASLDALTDPPTLTWVVEDTGIGISPKAQPTIFHRHGAPPEEPTPEILGRRRGVGLSITQALVHRLGGTIAVDSQLGIGSRFTVVLPIEVIPKPARAVKYYNCRNKPERGMGPTALVVDDSKTNRCIMRSYLQILGFRTRSCASLGQALESYRRGRYDLVVMDKNLPDGDGARFPEMIRDVAGVHPYLLLVTAENRTGSPLNSAKEGFGAVLSKPLSLDQLRQAVEPLGLSRPSEKQPDEHVDSERYAEIRRRLVDLFMSQVDGEFASIESSMRDGDLKEVAFVAHRLIGGAGNAGLVELVPVCRKLETDASHGEIAQLQVGVGELRDAISRLRRPRE